MTDDREDKDRKIMERHGASSLKKLDANSKLIASILATTVIILGSAITIINIVRGDPTPTPSVSGPSQDSDVVNLDSDTDTPPEPRATPGLIAPDDGDTVSNAGQMVEFSWDDSLGEGEQYILVIYHMSQDCKDPDQCMDVHWINTTKYELPEDSSFLWKENQTQSRPLRWQVLVADTNISGREPNHLPDDDFILAESDHRSIVIVP